MNWMPCYTWNEIRRQQTWLEKKNNKQTNKRENKHIKKEDYFKKNYDDYCSLFFLRNSNVLPSINLATLTITKKNYLLFHIPRFFQNWLTHEKKIPLLLTHSFLIIIPLLQRNDAYWIMYLKKRKKHTKGRLPQSPKNWNNLSVIHSLPITKLLHTL